MRDIFRFVKSGISEMNRVDAVAISLVVASLVGAYFLLSKWIKH